MPEDVIYLDNHATTRPDVRVVEAMLPYLQERYGNASARTHAFGQEAADAVEEARGRVARALGAEAREITFTSGATESNRLAIEAALVRSRRAHAVVSAIEHRSVLDAIPGPKTCVKPGRDGIVDPAAVRRAITPETGVVSVMAANNEIGTLQPVQEIARICRESGVAFHCDATAAVGRTAFDVRVADADFVSFSGHKIHGPKGIGALYARAGSGTVGRPGTPNVPGIVGLATALDLCLAEREPEAERLLRLRTRLLAALTAAIDEVTPNGDLARRLPGNLNVTFGGIEGRALLIALRGVAVSAGSACSSASVEPSHVLLAIGRSREEALASLRFGIGRFNTDQEIDSAAARVAEVVQTLHGSRRFRTGTLESPRVLGNTSHADRL